ncbi:MAG TPA: hypothetical protein VIF62_17440 [Labilithrix sp.]
MTSRSCALAFSSIVLAAGCGGVTWGSGAGSSAKAYPITAEVLDAQTPDLCASSLRSLDGGSPTDGGSNAALVVAVRRASKTARIKHESAPPAAPSVLTTRFGATAASDEKWSLTGAPATGPSGELAQRVRATGAAYSRATIAQQTCFLQVMGGNLGAMSQVLHEKYDDPLVAPDVARARVRKLLQELRQIEAEEAALTGILAAYEGALAGQIDPAIVDKLSAALDDVRTKPVTVSDADFAKAWAFAEEKANALDAESHKWSASEGERLSLLGLQRAAARARSSRGGYGDDQRSRVPLSEASEPGSFGALAESGKGGAVGKALKGLLTGNVAAVVAGAAELLPEDNPFVVGIKGAAALASGDYVTAMKQASLLAPKDSAVAAVLAAPDALTSSARALGAR